MKSKFQTVFGSSPQIRIMERLIEKRKERFILKPFMEDLGINYTIGYETLNYYLEKGFIVEHRKVGNTREYRLNLSNGIIRKLICVYKALEDMGAKQ